jgi:hypothetical protein
MWVLFPLLRSKARTLFPLFSPFMCIAQRVLAFLPSLTEPGHLSVFIRLLLDRCDDRITEIIRKFSELSLLDRVNDEIAGIAKQ